MIMEFTTNLTDTAVLEELGQRITRQRVDRNLTQAALADSAGLAKRTLERLESGSSVQLVSLIRVLRVLDLLPQLDAVLPPAEPGPLDHLQRAGKRRQRASRSAAHTRVEPWRWDDDA